MTLTAVEAACDDAGLATTGIDAILKYSHDASISLQALAATLRYARGTGAFGSKKPHSVWAGVSMASEMFALQAEIERICQRIGLPSDPRKFTPHVTLARLRSSRVEDVVEYLSGRGNFVTAPFTVSRFVLLSSRDSVGGGPYLTEEVFPLHEERSNLASNEEHPASSVW